MVLKAKFLGLTEDVFINKENGQSIPYARLFLFDEKSMEYYKLPIDLKTVEKVKEGSPNFGSDCSVEVKFDASQKNQLKVIDWN